jgi:hypothetical protein
LPGQLEVQHLWPQSYVKVNITSKIGKMLGWHISIQREVTFQEWQQIYGVCKDRFNYKSITLVNQSRKTLRGVTLYCFCFGKLPFPGNSIVELSAAIHSKEYVLYQIYGGSQILTNLGLTYLKELIQHYVTWYVNFWIKTERQESQWRSSEYSNLKD